MSSPNVRRGIWPPRNEPTPAPEHRDADFHTFSSRRFPRAMRYSRASPGMRGREAAFADKN
jgi:hypothetical protein